MAAANSSTKRVMSEPTRLGSRWRPIIRGERAPLISDASTNSDVRSVNTRFRVTRVNTIHPDMAMTTMTIQTLGPKTTANISPASTPGKAIWTSAAEEMAVSAQPLK